MNDTPRTDAMVFDADLVSASFARELERENTHLLVLATNAEFDRSKLERELAEAKAENARLREGFAPSIHAIEINARANEEAAGRATEARDISWSQGVTAGLRLALSYLPNVQAQR